MVGVKVIVLIERLHVMKVSIVFLGLTCEREHAKSINRSINLN